MINSERVQRLFSSPLFLFLYFCCFFGIFMQLAFGPKPFSWGYVAIYGIPFGLIMTAVTLRKIDKEKELTGHLDQKQLHALRTAIKTGVLPSDPAVQKTLPVYLQENAQYKRLYKKRKWDRYFIVPLVIMGALHLLAAVSNHDAVQFIVSAFVIGIITAALISSKRATNTIASLYQQLGIDPEATTSPELTAKSDDQSFGEWKRSSVFIIVAILLVLVLAYNVRPQKASNDVVPETSTSANQADSGTANSESNIPGSQSEDGSNNTILITIPTSDLEPTTTEQSIGGLQGNPSEPVPGVYDATTGSEPPD